MKKRKTLSEEHKRKIGLAHKGKIITQEQREKTRQKLKGKKKSPEHIAKLRNINLGKKLSEETRKKISSSNKGRKLSEETKIKMSISKYGSGEKTEPHKWITRQLGKPNYCEHCGRTDKIFYHWSNINHEYKKDIRDWQRLCVPCHIKYDRQFNGKKYPFEIRKELLLENNLINLNA